MEAREKSKIRKRKVLDFGRSPLDKGATFPDFRISRTFRPSVRSRRRKLSFNFPRNSNKVAWPSRVLGTGVFDVCTSPGNILNSHFTGLWALTLSAGSQSRAAFGVWSPAMRQRVPSKRDSDAGRTTRPDLDRKKSFARRTGLKLPPVGIRRPCLLFSSSCQPDPCKFSFFNIYW